MLIILSRKGYKIEQWPTYDDIINFLPKGMNYRLVNDVIWIQPIKM